MSTLILRAERLHNDMFYFLGDAATAYNKHFQVVFLLMIFVSACDAVIRGKNDGQSS